jgi:Lipoprotein LpqB beta-propeller domain/Sporulation and spore germination
MASSRPALRRPGSRRSATHRASAAIRGACCAAAIALPASGCALVPASDNVHEVTISQGGSSQNQEYPQLLPRGPGKGWTPDQIVNGFLRASASFANHFAVARAYLTKSEARSWHPGGAVTVMGALLQTPPNNVPKRQPDEKSYPVTTVQVHGAQLATLTRSGQYVPSPASSASRKLYNFDLIKIGKNWRISGLPTSGLMLTKDELERVYQQRNLYFLDPPRPRSRPMLVPDPVFVPQNDTSSDLATKLVNGLLHPPQGWLAGATRTAFPAGTRLLGPVSINGPNATVDLAVPRSAVRSMKQAQLAAQLVWTLTSTSYGPTAIQIVEIQINGRMLTLNGGPYQWPKRYQDWVPDQPAPPGPYFVSPDGTVRQISSTGPTAAPQSGAAKFSARAVPGQAGTAEVPVLSTIAVEPNQGTLAGLSGDGKIVYIGDLSRKAVLSSQHLDATYSSLSWDVRGNLWVAGNSSLLVLWGAHGSNSQEFNPKDLAPGDRLAAFRVAPDGVRVAMIVKNRAGASRILLGAITHNGPAASIGQTVAIGSQIPAPQDVTWYDADHVIVLTQVGNRAQLEEVPLNGGQPVPVSTVNGTTSVTAAGGRLAVGLANGRMSIAPAVNALWQQVSMFGRGPAYPG